ncbi:MAG: hypothetical protein H6782_00930 [Candidatus Nomurabacteria bacterium]|nr:MAG: hypothetical protein H6782_00930 [Candidatus Nomurabacteria bacterium]
MQHLANSRNKSLFFAFSFFAPHFFLLKAEKKRVCFGRRNGVEPRAQLSGLLVKLLRILFVERSNFVQKHRTLGQSTETEPEGRRRASGGAVPCGGKAKGERRGTESVRTEMDGFVVLVVNI